MSELLSWRSDKLDITAAATHLTIREGKTGQVAIRLRGAEHVGRFSALLGSVLAATSDRAQDHLSGTFVAFTRLSPNTYLLQIGTATYTQDAPWLVDIYGWLQHVTGDNRRCDTGGMTLQVNPDDRIVTYNPDACAVENGIVLSPESARLLARKMLATATNLAARRSWSGSDLTGRFFRLVPPMADLFALLSVEQGASNRGTQLTPFELYRHANALLRTAPEAT